MRKRIQSLAVVSILCFSLCVGGILEGQTIVKAAGTSKSDAETIDFGDIITSQLSVEGQNDWYTFKTDKSEISSWYEVGVMGEKISGNGANPACILYDSYGEEVEFVSQERSKEGEYGHCYTKLSPDATYYMKISTYYSNEGTSDYTTYIKNLGDEGSEIMEDAVDITTNSKHKYELQHEKDSDWFTFTAKGDNPSYKFIPLESYMYVTVYNEDGEKILDSKSSSANTGVSQTIKANKGDKLFVDVDSWYGGKYTLTITDSAQVKVGQVILKRVTKSSRNSVDVIWEDIMDIDGYQVTYAQNSSFTKNVKSITTSFNSVAIKNLSKGKTYYYKVRAYKVNSDGKKVYGAYSIIEKVKM